MAVMEWVGETWRTYVGNATSVRDFRVQMRGTKTILAWSLYLIVLLFVAYAFYANVAKEMRVPYEGDVLTQVLKDTRLKSDPIHPNAAGYRLIAERVAARLKQAGAI